MILSSFSSLCKRESPSALFKLSLLCFVPSIRAFSYWSPIYRAPKLVYPRFLSTFPVSRMMTTAFDLGTPQLPSSILNENGLVLQKLIYSDYDIIEKELSINQDERDAFFRLVRGSYSYVAFLLFSFSFLLLFRLERYIFNVMMCYFN
jgi:hypothetical protein